MEGLSVAASIAGLLQVGAKVISFLSTAADAPTTARNVLSEIRALHVIFRQLQNFITHFTEQSMSRKSRIYVDDLVITLTGCVCTFSELDKELECLRTEGDEAGNRDDPQFSTWDRVKWAAKEQSLLRMLENLQMHKNSLTLLLSIYTWCVTVPVFSTTRLKCLEHSDSDAYTTVL